MSDPIPHIYFIAFIEAKRLHRRTGFTTETLKKQMVFFLNTMPFDENLFDFVLCETDLNVFFHFVLFIGFSFSCYLLDDNVLFSCKNTPIRVMRNCSGRVSKDFDELHVCSIF